MGLALTGRRTRRSNLLPADLSLTPVPWLSMLQGTHSLVAFNHSNYFGYSGLIILSRWLYSSDINDIVVIVNIFLLLNRISSPMMSADKRWPDGANLDDVL
ncbi:hypothetical protein SEEH3547_13000 [Salmonella enterica subsp. enterica serovar Heidelberg str. 75-3547]|nr:hypothetical protein SEEH3101_13539 [Salmonella enterica subsp. enterica serovar Heidelberg str. 607310-1]KJT81195.1 hypothetical protein SEEH3547_13000 [Salmonella enterica subsp. enterica serovar Heidelberg str. 75-3547]